LPRLKQRILENGQLHPLRRHDRRDAPQDRQQSNQRQPVPLQQPPPAGAASPAGDAATALLVPIYPPRCGRGVAEARLLPYRFTPAARTQEAGDAKQQRIVERHRIGGDTHQRREPPAGAARRRSGSGGRSPLARHHTRSHTNGQRRTGIQHRRILAALNNRRQLGRAPPRY
jgi:hypothetical protein